MVVLTGICTAAVMALVFAIIIFAIFSLARFYLNSIYDTLEMTNSGRI
jgi:hypothetical protein